MESALYSFYSLVISYNLACKASLVRFIYTSQLVNKNRPRAPFMTYSLFSYQLR